MRIVSDERAFVALDGLVTENRNELARAEAQIRRINEQLEGVAASASLTSVSWQRQIEQIQSRVAVAAVALLELEREIREVNLAASRSRLELLQRQLIVANADARFTQADLDKVLASIETERSRLEQELADAESQHRDARAALDSARQLLSESQTRSGSSVDLDARTAELVGARSAQWDTASTEFACFVFGWKRRASSAACGS